MKDSRPPPPPPHTHTHPPSPPPPQKKKKIVTDRENERERGGGGIFRHTSATLNALLSIEPVITRESSFFKLTYTSHTIMMQSNHFAHYEKLWKKIIWRYTPGG